MSISDGAALVDAGLAVQWSRSCSFYVYYDGNVLRELQQQRR